MGTSSSSFDSSLWSEHDEKDRARPGELPSAMACFRRDNDDDDEEDDDDDDGSAEASSVHLSAGVLAAADADANASVDSRVSVFIGVTSSSPLS